MWQQSVKFWYQMLQFEDLCLSSPAGITIKSFPTLQITTIWCFSSGVYMFAAVNLIYLCSLINRKMNQTYWLKHPSSLKFSLLERGKNRGEKQERSNKSTCWREKKIIKKTFLSNISFVRSEAWRRECESNVRLKDHMLAVNTQAHTTFSISVELSSVRKLFNRQLSYSPQQWQSQRPLEAGEYLIPSSYLNNAAWKN